MANSYETRHGKIIRRILTAEEYAGLAYPEDYWWFIVRHEHTERDGMLYRVIGGTAYRSDAHEQWADMPVDERAQCSVVSYRSLLSR